MSRDQAEIRKLYVRLKNIDIAIQSLEALQRRREKGETLVQAKRILSRAA